MTHVCSCPRQHELGQEQSRQDKVIEVTSFVISNHAVWLRSTSSIRCLTAPLGQHSTLLASWHDVLTSQMAACGIVGLMGSFVFVFSKNFAFCQEFCTKSAANYTATPGWISSSKARTHWIANLTIANKPWISSNFHISTCLRVSRATCFRSKAITAGCNSHHRHHRCWALRNQRMTDS